MSLAEGSNKFMRGRHAVTDEGVFVITTSNKNEYREDSNGIIIGLTDNSRAIIDKFDLNKAEFVEQRKYSLQQAEFYQSRRGLEKFAKGELTQCLTKIQSLASENLRLDDSKKAYLNNLLYSNIVTALEVFLADTLIYRIESDQQNLKSFIKHYPRWKDMNFPQNNDSGEIDDILEKGVREIRQSLLFHNLEMAKKIYRYTLNLEAFPDISELNKAVDIRHDLIHRNGRKPDGNFHEINNNCINELCDQVWEFSGAIGFALSELEYKKANS